MAKAKKIEDIVDEVVEVVVDPSTQGYGSRDFNKTKEVLTEVTPEELITE